MMLQEIDLVLIMLLPVVISLLEAFNCMTGRSLSMMGVIPRRSGPLTLISWHVLHGSFQHYLSNITPLIIFSVLVPLMVGIGWYVVISLLLFVMTSILLWVAGRNRMHIGASGLVFAYAFFVVAMAIFRVDWIYILIALVGLVYYIALNIKLLNFDMKVSAEAHFLGAFSGVFCAYLMAFNPWGIMNGLLVVQQALTEFIYASNSITLYSW